MTNQLSIWLLQLYNMANIKYNSDHVVHNLKNPNTLFTSFSQHYRTKAAFVRHILVCKNYFLIKPQMFLQYYEQKKYKSLLIMGL